MTLDWITMSGKNWNGRFGVCRPRGPATMATSKTAMRKPRRRYFIQNSVGMMAAAYSS